MGKKHIGLNEAVKINGKDKNDLNESIRKVIKKEIKSLSKK